MKLSAFCIILALTTFQLTSNSLWEDRDLFTNRRNVRAGDIIKIVFEYKNLIRYRNQSKAGTSRQVNVGRPGITTFSFLPAFDLTMSSKDDDGVDYTTEKEFSARIAVQVTALQPNGNILIQGRHTIVVNGQSEYITLQGTIRRDDLRDGDSILAQDIANLQFSYQGPQAQQRNLIRPGDLVYTNSSATNAGTAPPADQVPTLTEAARRRMILEYLNRVASLLFAR